MVVQYAVIVKCIWCTSMLVLEVIALNIAK